MLECSGGSSDPSLLKHETGILLVLTGNADEPEVGPSVLTREELITAFERNGEFELLELSVDRFDDNEFYRTLEKRPLAWFGVFRRK